MNRRQIIVPLLASALLMIISASTSFAQSRTVSESRPGNTLREKAFIHTDRGTYLTGETIWFSLYCSDVITNKPSGLSKVAYVELTGPGKNATVHTKIVLVNGNGNGYLPLSSSLPSGRYTLRGWTQWMRNFTDEGCYQASLTIINPAKRPEPVATIQLASPLAGFYPEGGHLVEGVEGLVACHVTDAQGKGWALTGAVLRNGTDTVSRFTTSSRGFGKFQLRPEPGANYSVALFTADGRNGTYPLPAADKTGYVFSVHGNATQGYTVNATPSATMAHERLTLVLMLGKTMIRAWEGQHTGSPVAWVIPKGSLPDGVSRLLLFNQAGEPLAERSLFQRPVTELLNLRAYTDQAGFGNRKPVELHVESHTAAMAPAPSTFSVSVYKSDSLEMAEPERMTDWFWLGSALRGRVEDPHYYLSDSAATEATDLLMLTQGWSRFKWSDTASPVIRYAPEYAGHLITGTVTRRSDGTPLKGIPAYLSVQGKRFHFGSALSDQDGRVAFDLKKLYGNGSIILQTGIDSTAHVQLDDPWKNDFQKPAEQPLRLDPAYGDLLRKAVLYNRAGLKTPASDRFYFPDATDSLPFFGKAEKTYLLDDYTRFRTFDEVFREFIPEVQVKRSKGTYELRVDHAPLPEFFSTDPLMLLDGVPYFNTNEVMNFDPTKIRKIDIVNRHFYQGSQDYSGIISMTSYEGDGGGIPLNPNALLLEYEGLQLRREFPATEYRTPEQLSSHQPDFRRLLHWAPSVWTGEKGKADLRFYTGDDKGRYLVVVQGLSDDGLVGTSVSSFEVK